MEGGPALVLSEEVVVGELVNVCRVVGHTDPLKLSEDVGDVLDGVVCHQFSVGAAALIAKFPRWEGRCNPRDGECKDQHGELEDHHGWVTGELQRGGHSSMQGKELDEPGSVDP